MLGQTDNSKVVDFYGKACYINDMEGYCNLGLAYNIGLGIKKDIKKAQSSF